MLNPLTRWEPGTLVRYHGSLTDLHGVYQAYPCGCVRCDDPFYGSHKFRLVGGDGRIVVECVRASSITAAWDDTPAQAARYDRAHWTDRYDTDEEN